jgi:hypothetical protein
VRWCQGRRIFIPPDEPAAGLIGNVRVRKQEFVLQIVQRRLIKAELPLQRLVRHAAATADHVNGLIHHFLERHDFAPPA